MLNLFLYLSVLITTIYNYSIPSLNGGDINFSDFAGKKILLVNVASHSKYGSQLRQLDSLQQRYADSLVVVVIPSNSFGNEPMESADLQLMTNDYHFKVAAKSEVRGDNAIDLYKWITSADSNGRFGSEVKDDFQKYLVGADGNLIGIFLSSVNPCGTELTSALGNQQ